MPVEVGLGVSEKFIVDPVRVQRTGEGGSDIGHVFEEELRVPVGELV